MKCYTVFGGRGFIGSEIVGMLEASGQDVWVPPRDDENIFETDLGIVIYSAGQGDCKNSPLGVFDANCRLLADLLERGKFERLVYVSSTRVYMNHDSSSEEDDLKVCTDDQRRLFNLTKLVSEELCLKSGRNITIVRPSNVYGVALHSPLFLPAITRNAINNGKVDMYIDHNYAKDYVSVTDVASACIALADHPDSLGEVINIAAGYNITAQQIADVLQKHTECDVIWHNISFPNEIFPETNIEKIKSYIKDYKPRNVLFDLEKMIADFYTYLK
ncbi:SDR family oxidoreductase [Aeromonas encheleia]|uniref:NAD-dependent epimerase/dehydratase family protein n=1 Tax=Aeromonas TaxID=642 RepID=UPI001C48EEB6|nr:MULTISPECIES: SDR family oxidoreductase [Aeromonas]MBV7598797.1 SDR family oxidoreductase [Aeromonas sp. sia0103]UNP89662.1 SDR family oxidoreductase [Aeromonas encheleia]